ncbi:MAG: glycosyltransferase [Prevotellaceae bacterium]|jgi:GT2 family glycosyltransferase|nr:glycosyltransferase [Prevotellaceae bacterium]
MISIITAIHNQYAMNELFIHSLKKYTRVPYELIIIDNNSTDGSRELFEKNGAVIIRNNSNYSYPYCQNQGIRKASYGILVFLNNDVILSPDWDIYMLDVIGKNNYEVISFASNDRSATGDDTTRFSRRWKRIKYPIIACLGISKFSLRLMFKLMYWKWERFTKAQFHKYGYCMREGFSGSAIAMTKTGIEKVGLWDEQIQGADFDLYARCKQRNENYGDLQPLSIVSGIYIHHYERITIKAKRKPVLFTDVSNLISSEQKWGAEKWKNIINEYNRLP